MWFKRSRVYDVPDADTVMRTCENCGNETEFKLVWTKAGPGIGVPIVMLFTDKATLAVRIWAIQCPTCGWALKVKQTVAKGLRLKGKAAG